MIDWLPHSDFEQKLGDDFTGGQLGACYHALMSAQFVMPVKQEVHEGDARPEWATYDDEERTWVCVFTSFESMHRVSNGAMQYGAVMTLAELAAAWPDTSWGLAINPGLYVSFHFDAGMVARLAAPALGLLYKALPDTAVIMQKVLPLFGVEELFERHPNTVSGYCQLMWHVQHIATPQVMLEALGLIERELYEDEYGSIFVLRWPAIGLPFYTDTYGGTTEQERINTSGTIIEEPPFRGMGYGPNPDQVIREFKAIAAPLTTGAELWEMTADGRSIRRGIFDGVIDRWRAVSPQPTDGDPPRQPRMMASSGPEDDDE